MTILLAVSVKYARWLFGGLASMALFALMMVTLVDVLGRNFFNHPLPGAIEITEFLLCIVILLSFPLVTLLNQHLVIELFETSLGPRLNKIGTFLSAGLGMGLYAVAARYLWILAARSARNGEITPTLQWPYAPMIYLMSVLCAASAVAFLLSVTVPRTETDAIIG